ncbi:hypothetical protein K8354_18200 [Polaribacter litorisediminis]|uniref:hypothetical protein n=1 Tax=Polaribacter litorisediminis TaxID=1908341 RepID=UPI001CBD8784|nr:hypothetical protein [Polaribacter litorisediminis]UAM98181.1 hypothetical protein K8354_18200 [Polaribacter litorisediminis]
MNLTKKDKLEIFENAISWIVVLAMLIYGLGKVAQFEDAVDVNKTVAEMTGMELMWAFYSYSKSFVITLGIMEVTGGILILIKKTRLIGCLLTTAILVNVILQDIFYGVHLGALKAAILYQFLILVILWIHKDKMIASIKALVNFEKVQQTKAKYFVKLLIAFGVFVVLRILEYYFTIKF